MKKVLDLHFDYQNTT